MPQPTGRDLYDYNEPLTNISVAYMQEATGFIAKTFAPIVPVRKESGVYYKYTKDFWLREGMKKRPRATEAEGGGYEVTPSTPYVIDKWSEKKDIADEDRTNTQDPLDADEDAALWLGEQAMIRRERLFAEKALVTGVWGRDRQGKASGETGTQFRQFNDAASIPVEVVSGSCDYVHSQTGRRPNKISMGREVYSWLKLHPDILARVQYGAAPGNPAVVTKQVLAQIFEVEELHVMDGVYCSTAEGASTATYAFIGGKNILLGYVAPRPSLRMPSALYTLAWTEIDGAGPDGQRVKKIRMPLKDADRVELDLYTTVEIVAADCGELLYDAVA